MGWLKPSIAWKLYLVSGIVLLLLGSMGGVAQYLLTRDLLAAFLTGGLGCVNLPIGFFMLLTAWLLHGDDEEPEE